MPNTVNLFLNVPNTGDLPGAWGTTAVNYNMTALDGLLGGSLTLSLSAATTFVLGLPAGSSYTPGAGPSQSENALIKFTGTLTGNAVCKLTRPGTYTVHNACSGFTSFYIQISPASGGGNSIGAPPGRKCRIYFDGTDVDYLDPSEVGSALDLHQSVKTLPVWMTACTVSPYLIKNGAVYNISQYPALGAVLGSTFGGNGASTFGVPNEDARVRVAVDTGVGGGRLTTALCGIDGKIMGQAGGDQDLQGHSHAVNITDPGHTHGLSPTASLIKSTGASLQLGAGGGSAQTITVDSSVTGLGIAIVTTGGAVSGNVQPTIISFLALIKT